MGKKKKGKTTSQLLLSCSEEHIAYNLMVFAHYRTQYDQYLRSGNYPVDVETLWQDLKKQYTSDPAAFAQGFETPVNGDQRTFPAYVADVLTNLHNYLDRQAFEIHGVAAGLAAMLQAKHFVDADNAWHDLKGGTTVDDAVAHAPAFPPPPRTAIADITDDQQAVIDTTAVLAGTASGDLADLPEVVENLASSAEAVWVADASRKAAKKAALENPDVDAMDIVTDADWAQAKTGMSEQHDAVAGIAETLKRNPDYGLLPKGAAGSGAPIAFDGATVSAGDYIKCESALELDDARDVETALNAVVDDHGYVEISALLQGGSLSDAAKQSGRDAVDDADADKDSDQL